MSDSIGKETIWQVEERYGHNSTTTLEFGSEEDARAYWEANQPSVLIAETREYWLRDRALTKWQEDQAQDPATAAFTMETVSPQCLDCGQPAEECRCEAIRQAAQEQQ